MAEHTVLDAVLDNTQVPSQPFVVIVDSAVFSGFPVFKEALRRALNRGGPVLLVTALYRPESLLPSGPPGNATVVDVSAVPDLNGDAVVDIEGEVSRQYSSLPAGAQVFIDALDIIAEDRSPATAMKLVRSLLKTIKTAKPPSRLTLLLPRTAAILPSLIPPTLSPTLTLLHPYHPNLFSHLSRLYLMPIDSSPAFWQIIERARDRSLPETLAYGGHEGIEVIGDWSRQGSILQVLVRKATGGVKGISRSLSAIKQEDGVVRVRPITDLVSANPINAPSLGGTAIDKPPTTHVDLDLPFNLSLTDEQKKRRGEVPLPYAHEGEGVGIEFGEEEDEDDEEI